MILIYAIPIGVLGEQSNHSTDTQLIPYAIMAIPLPWYDCLYICNVIAEPEASQRSDALQHIC